MNEAVDITKQMCPVDGAKCDRKCGFPFHGTLTRKKDAICPKMAEDCDLKCGYDTHMSKESNENQNICLSCEG